MAAEDGRMDKSLRNSSVGGENVSRKTFLKLQPNSFHTGVNRKCLCNTREEEGEEETDRDGLCVCRHFTFKSSAPFCSPRKTLHAT